jgi:hypothetical protein
MRNGARLLWLAGNRFTGTLTNPNVKVPDQKGRILVCPSPFSELFDFRALFGSCSFLLD